MVVRCAPNLDGTAVPPVAPYDRPAAAGRTLAAPTRGVRYPGQRPRAARPADGRGNDATAIALCVITFRVVGLYPISYPHP